MSAREIARSLLDALAAQGVVVRRLTADSRAVEAGDVFLAYPGSRADGRRFIANAVAAGAAAVLWERDGHEWDAALAVPNLPCLGLSAIAGELAAQALDEPSRKLRLIGVTGTNGKTSCSQWIASALAQLGEPCGIIGTLGIGFPGKLTENLNTTPDSLVLHQSLADFLAHGARATAMEVSSIGLEQGRVNGAHFDIAVFTNLSRDHLDYHGSMQAYAAAKAHLFDWPELRAAVLNLDDHFGVELAERCAGRLPLTIGYTLGECPEQLPTGIRVLAASHVRDTPTGAHFDVFWSSERSEVETHLVGRFNVSNALAVMGTLLAAGHDLEDVVSAVRQLQPPPGRMQSLGGVMQPLVVVDYAHTPDALEKALEALRPTAHARGGRLVCVFGCGGDRDPGKRPMMGAAAARYADRVVITSDNPRSEDPGAIVEQVAAGAGSAAVCIVDRAQAIVEAVTHAGADDVILIAGKGHEPYQEVHGQRLPFSDSEQAKAALKRWPAGEVNA